MTYTIKDLVSDQEVRWCPGCGDYSILKQVQTVLPELNIPKEDIVFVSGIGCSSRFPYYMNTYGVHSIHGRAPAFATGLKLANPKLSVWVITGDGDALSIGGNHLIHTLRRNPDINILLFNNEIYGLTKGQYSPTSKVGANTKSSPFGTVDIPFNPLALALGANAAFVARTMDRDPVHLRTMLKRTHQFKGSGFLEIYQNCNVFNDGAFEQFTEKKSKEETTLFLEHGKPLIFGTNKSKGLKLEGLQLKVVDLNNHGIEDLMLHDEHDYMKAQLLVRCFDEENDLPRPFGVFYENKNATPYEQIVYEQQTAITSQKGQGNLEALIKGTQNWEVA